MDDAQHVAKIAQYGGASTAFFCGLSANQFATWGGLLIGLLGLLVNFVFQLRRDQRDAERLRHEIGGKGDDA